MTNNHPITPPLELVQQWAHMFEQHTDAEVFTQAASWGANQELEACLKLLEQLQPQGNVLANGLRSVRRPKPPSLKEQALQLVEVFTTPSGWCGAKLTAEQCDTIRRALEQLDD